ncbi:radical SAM protein [Syntrophotalea acetylenivorans]|uniref:Radical SAM protein n=1 Tax=Syntrophotalea acetylenivorans TaxID=1842532 RepID=A0A1L3GQ62_9BACT|nr:radical SAM (seleno)protein TrsS [Syntrophotalea acetylenivorans]APG28035.1 radical SAM protein [Syntrophotalea acetylenivorans]
MPEQHTFATETASLCPICLQRVPAHRQIVDEQVDLLKFCPEHGEFRTLIWHGPPLLSDWNRPKIPSQPPVCLTESEGGCPYDCGLCPNHGQHSCSVLLEITARCNLSCPVCFAASSTQAPPDPTLAAIDRWYKTAKRASGTGIVIQLSGGEPTVREDLPAIIEMGRRHGFAFIQLNSNGLRLAQEPGYAKRLKEAGLNNVFLQFDGTEDTILRTLRGRDLLKEKILAIDHCVDSGLGVVLVPTVVPGVNDDNLGAILDFALDWAPGVRGVHFQPISYFGRFPKAPADDDRITLPQIMRGIEEQTKGRMRREHFAPPGCEHSHCSFHGNFLVEENGNLRALTKAGDCGCNKPKPASEGAEKSKEFLAQQWAAPAQPKPSSAADNEFDAFIERVRSHTFAVSAMAFQDAWNIDLERARSCCIHVMSVEETLVPFCLYNLTAASGKPLYRGGHHAG